MSKKRWKLTMCKANFAMDMHRKEVAHANEMVTLGDYAEASLGYVRAADWLEQVRALWKILDFLPKADGGKAQQPTTQKENETKHT